MEKTKTLNVSELEKNKDAMIHQFDLKGKFLDVNKKWMDRMGYDKEDLKKISIESIIHPDHLDECFDKFGLVSKGEALEKVETSFLTKSNKRIDVNMDSLPIFNNKGEVESVICMFKEA